MKKQNRKKQSGLIDAELRELVRLGEYRAEKIVINLKRTHLEKNWQCESLGWLLQRALEVINNVKPGEEKHLTWDAQWLIRVILRTGLQRAMEQGYVVPDGFARQYEPRAYGFRFRASRN